MSGPPPPGANFRKSFPLRRNGRILINTGTHRLRTHNDAMMKTNILLLITVVMLFSRSAHAQTVLATADRTRGEITEALTLWNTAAKKGSSEDVMALFDTSPAGILLVGSDKGEVYKGTAEVRRWLGMLFAHAGFSWEMDRVDIDASGATAWVFVEGSMVVRWDTGQTRKSPYRFTGFLVKKEDGWRWRLFNGSSPNGE
jgi:ketosteroid isomerase-like protein